MYSNSLFLQLSINSFLESTCDCETTNPRIPFCYITPVLTAWPSGWLESWLGVILFHKNCHKERWNSPVCLQTKPPAVRSGYVHLASLRTGRLCASVPAEVSQNAQRETFHCVSILIVNNVTSSTFIFHFFLFCWCISWGWKAFSTSGSTSSPTSAVRSLCSLA